MAGCAPTDPVRAAADNAVATLEATSKVLVTDAAEQEQELELEQELAQ